MKTNLTLSVLVCMMLASCSDKPVTESKTEKEKTLTCSDDACRAKSKPGELTCKLSSPELKKRKETILASLRKQVLEKKELSNGYAFKFSGSDAMIDELHAFIKTERQCCDFFTFTLSISGDKGEAWLELTGVDGAKDFVTEELGL